MNKLIEFSRKAQEAHQQADIAMAMYEEMRGLSNNSIEQISNVCIDLINEERSELYNHVNCILKLLADNTIRINIREINYMKKLTDLMVTCSDEEILEYNAWRNA